MTPTQIGEFLEANGASDDEIDEFLAHHGVKGMKWGQRRAARLNADAGREKFGNRNNASTQKRIDRVARVASGKASVGDQIRAGLFNVPVGYILKEFSLKGGSQDLLDRNQKYQKKVIAGKSKVNDTLLRLGGIDVRSLNYKYTPSNI